MFGIGMPEMILILAIALIVIGPQKLPDLAKSLGRAMREFKKATNEFKETIAIDDDFKEAKHTFDSLDRELRQNLSSTEPEKSTDLPPAPDEEIVNETDAPRETDSFEEDRNAPASTESPTADDSGSTPPETDANSDAQSDAVSDDAQGKAPSA